MEHEQQDLVRRNYAKIYILFGLDTCVLFVPFIFEKAASLLWIVLAIHCFIVVWVGLLLNWISRVKERDSRFLLTLYWVIFLLTILTPGFIFMALWIIAAIIIKKEPAGDGLRNHEEQIDRQVKGPSQMMQAVPGSTWPLYVAVVFALASFALVIIMLGFDPSEFGGLGMLFVAIIATPFLLLIPGLLRIPAAREVKKSMVFAQCITYFMVALSWLILVLRASA
ncbi:MAG: hypothetical protein QNJ17_14875 [Desulfocapsaceae bacterium]|nr:hypothetical protein [Desulfocapsaceae bacterium]